MRDLGAYPAIAIHLRDSRSGRLGTVCFVSAALSEPAPERLEAVRAVPSNGTWGTGRRSFGVTGARSWRPPSKSDPGNR